MSKIVTITVNPSVDKNTTTDRVVPDAKLRCKPPKYEAGGGGINVSRAIKKLGGESLTLFPSGGPSGVLLKSLLENEDINYHSIDCQEWTRENLNLVDEQANQQFRFVMPGAQIAPEEIDQFMGMLSDLDQAEYIVVSGSTVPGLPDYFYTQVAEIAEKNKAKLIMDTSGDTLKLVLDKGLYMAKPNVQELCDITGSDLHAIENIETLAKNFIKEKEIELLVISLGAQGAMLVTDNTAEHITAPVVRRKSTVGAGDSMVGGIVLKLSEGWDVREAVRYGVACGTAATKNEGTQLCRKPDADNLYQKILKNNPLD